VSQEDLSFVAGAAFTWTLNSSSLYLNWSDPTTLKVFKNETIFPTDYNVVPIEVGSSSSGFYLLTNKADPTTVNIYRRVGGIHNSRRQQYRVSFLNPPQDSQINNILDSSTPFISTVTISGFLPRKWALSSSELQNRILTSSTHPAATVRTPALLFPASNSHLCLPLMYSICFRNFPSCEQPLCLPLREA